MTATEWAAFTILAAIFIAVGVAALALIVRSGRHSRAEDAAELAARATGAHDEFDMSIEERQAEAAWLAAKFDASVDVVPGRETGGRR